MPDFLRAALYYAQDLGWAVFPLRPADKVPLTAHGLKDATTDPERITAWWTDHPTANIAVATGEISGVVVVDIDGPDGERALAALGSMPPTPVSNTGKGRHLVFRRPPDGLRNSAGKLGPQLDVRGDGGYVVVPPSVHPSGSVYAWERGASPAKVDAADVPAPVLAKLWAVTGSSAPLRIVRDGEGPASEIPLLESVPEGTRNQTLAEYAGRLLAKGISELETLALVRALNATACKPPLPAPEVESIVTSIAAAERRSRTARARDVLDPTPNAAPRLVPIDASIFDVLAERNLQPIDVFPTMLGRWNDACRGFGGGQGLPRGWHVTVGGASGTGKSLFALNLVSSALHHGAKVAYISLEMSADQLLARLLAIFADRPIRELEPGTLYSEQTYRGAVEEFLSATRDGSALYIAERPESMLGSVTRQMESACDEGCRLVVVDYLQLIAVPDADGIAEQTRRASQALQRVAFTHGVTTVALSQFNRATSFAKEAPTIHGLTGSSSIENDSDQVVLLDHSANDRQGATMDTRVILAKNRHGPAPTIPVRWNFTNLRLTERAATVDESAAIHGIRTRAG